MNVTFADELADELAEELADELAEVEEVSEVIPVSVEEDICAICHEDFSGDLYTLPECSHIFHTNCIMTWFRMSKSSCPLCNNCGVNSLKDMEKLDWGIRNAAFMNYKRAQAFSRRKNAPESLKKQITALRKYVDKQKLFMKEYKEFKKSIPEGMTAQSILTKNCKLRRKKWRLQRGIRRRKTLIGFSCPNITNIIIPVKKNI